MYMNVYDDFLSHAILNAYHDRASHKKKHSLHTCMYVTYMYVTYIRESCENEFVTRFLLQFLMTESIGTCIYEHVFMTVAYSQDAIKLFRS